MPAPAEAQSREAIPRRQPPPLTRPQYPPPDSTTPCHQDTRALFERIVPGGKSEMDLEDLVDWQRRPLLATPPGKRRSSVELLVQKVARATKAQNQGRPPTPTTEKASALKVGACVGPFIVIVTVLSKHSYSLDGKPWRACPTVPTPRVRGQTWIFDSLKPA
jgi:hypothetical protein